MTHTSKIVTLLLVATLITAFLPVTVHAQMIKGQVMGGFEFGSG